jgi:16S rRNA (uracil1498-N3)-methyltransferase
MRRDHIGESKMSPRAPHRFYYAGHLHDVEGTVELSADESHHLIHVLRLRPGTLVDVFDATGAGFAARVATAEGKVARIELMGPIEQIAAAGHRLNIAIAVVKQRAMTLVIEKLSELGVDAVQPLLSERAVAGSDIQPHGSTPERWQRLAISAAKQCGRNLPLDIRTPSPVADWLKRFKLPAHLAYAHPAPGAPSFGQWLSGFPAVSLPLWVAIGPEGGWTPAETDAFEEAGFQAVTLGTLTLRSETAAIAVAATCRML